LAMAANVSLSSLAAAGKRARSGVEAQLVSIACTVAGVLCVTVPVARPIV